MFAILFWLGLTGVPAVALLIGGWHYHRKGYHQFLSRAMLALGSLLAILTLVILSGLAV